MMSLDVSLLRQQIKAAKELSNALTAKIDGTNHQPMLEAELAQGSLTILEDCLDRLLILRNKYLDRLTAVQHTTHGGTQNLHS